MKIQGSDLREKNRLPLQDVVPLSTPMSMYIEPANLCNIRCGFCPTGDKALIRKVGRAQGTMSGETFQLVLNGLSQFDSKVKLINFYKDGEPLINPRLPEMAIELHRYCEQLWLKTNGLMLTPALTDRLVGAGFDMIGISVIAPNAEGYRRISKAKVDYSAFIANIRNLYERRQSKLYIKMADVHFSPEEIQKFYDDYEPISDFCAIENLHGWSRTDLCDFRMGTSAESMDGVPNVKRIVCAWPLYQMTVNWNGTCQPCNEDWSHVNIVGDIHEASLPKIWRGEAFDAFRRIQLLGERFNNPACGTCWQTMSQLDDVDAYRAEILERLTRAACSPS